MAAAQPYPRRGEGGEILLPACGDRFLWPYAGFPPAGCPGVEPRAVTGRCTIRATVTVHRGVAARHLGKGPYRLCLVRLEEGVDLITRCPVSLPAPAVGDTLRLVWGDVAGRDWPVLVGAGGGSDRGAAHQ